MHTSTESKTTSLHVRRATREDIEFLAWCNYESASPYPGFCYWDPLLEGLHTDTMVFLQAVFATNTLAWGLCENFFVVEEAGKLIAGGSGFVMDTEDFRPFRVASLPTLASALGWDEAARAQFWQRYAEVWSDPKDSSLAPPASWVIECIAVVPEKRGQGIAKVLLQALLAEGKNQGHTHAGISVTMGNEPAQRVYDSLGFQMYMTYGAEYFDGAFPGTIKYRMRL